MKKEPSRMKSETKLGLANLLLTIITGIVITLYLNYSSQQLQIQLAKQQEQFQKELLQQQADITNKTALAQIQHKRSCATTNPCFTTIQIRNVGPAIAKNVRTVFLIQSRTSSWRGLLGDSERDLKVMVSPPSLQFSVATKRVEPISIFPSSRLSNPNIPGKNVIEISVGNLPPETSFDVSLTYTDSVQIATFQSYITTTLDLGSTSESQSQHVVDSIMLDYLQSKYSMASVDVSSSCENCTLSQDTYTFPLSSVSGWKYKSTNLISTENGLQWNSVTIVEYKIPKVLLSDDDRYSKLHAQVTSIDTAGQSYSYTITSFP
jgi:hypothetical protein